MIFIFNIIFISSCVSLISADYDDYSYEDAYDWADEYPQCGGISQSPIDISGDIVDEDYYNAGGGEPIIFENIYDTVAERMTLENNGHTLKLVFHWPNDTEKIPYVHGGPLDGEYITHAFQFRWGWDVNDGSEHQLGGRSFAMEMQTVHYNKKYPNYEEADGAKNGIVLYALFYTLGNEEFDFLTKIIEKLPEVAQPELSTDLEPFALGDYFDKDKPTSYMVYSGSLTYPPCTESIPWIVSDRIITVSKEQVRAFQQLNLLYGDNHNNRPLQSINGRLAKFAENS